MIDRDKPKIVVVGAASSSFSGILRDLVGNDYLVASHGDYTFSIPSGENMLDFVYRLNDEPDKVKEHCKVEMERMHECVDTLVPAGVDFDGPVQIARQRLADDVVDE